MYGMTRYLREDEASPLALLKRAVDDLENGRLTDDQFEEAVRTALKARKAMNKVLGTGVDAGATGDSPATAAEQAKFKAFITDAPGAPKTLREALRP